MGRGLLYEKEIKTLALERKFMKVAFLLPAYRIFKERCLPLSRLLISSNIEVKAFINFPFELDQEEVPVVHCDWPNFEWQPLKDMNPDLLIIWNGYFNYHHGAVKLLKKKYRTAIMEMGWFPQKESSYILDSIAPVSRLSSIPYIPYLKGVAKSSKNQELLEATRSKYDIFLPEGLSLPEKYYFIPMQLDYDTQIVESSPVFKTMNSFIYYVKNTLKDRTPVIIRNHPIEEGAIRPDIVHNFTEICSSIQLAVNSSCVIGVNSTVLAESILFQKRVFISGKHVCNPIFDHAGNVFEGPLPCSIEEYEDACDYRSLVLLYNQWNINSPEGWVVDSIISLAKGEYSPRIPL